MPDQDPWDDSEAVNDEMEPIGADLPATDGAPAVETQQATTSTGDQQQDPAAGEGEAHSTQSDDEGEEGNKQWTQKLALDERRKRQEIERANVELRERLARIEGMIESGDEEEAANSLDEIESEFWKTPLQVTDRIIQQRVNQVLAQRDYQRILASRERVRSKYDDFDSNVEVFRSEAQANPQLMQRLLLAPEPAEFAYQYAKKLKSQKEFDGKSPEEIKAELRAQIIEEAREEIKRELTEQGAAAFPTTNAGARGSGSRAAVYREATDDEIWGTLPS